MLPQRFSIDDPDPFLRWIGSSDPLQLDEIEMIQVWDLAGLATLSRHGHPSPIMVDTEGSKPATRFAKALGLESIITGQPPTGPAQEGRTVKLTRIQRFPGLSPYEVAGQISRLLIPDDTDDTRHTIYYVLAELLRNVVQHSRDPLGGIVGRATHDGGSGRI